MYMECIDKSKHTSLDKPGGLRRTWCLKMMMTKMRRTWCFCESLPFILNWILHLFCHVYHDLHCSPCTQQPTIKQEMLSVSPVEVQEHRRYVLNMPSKVWEKQPVSVMCEIEELVRMPCLVCEKPLHVGNIENWLRKDASPLLSTTNSNPISRWSRKNLSGNGPSGRQLTLPAHTNALLGCKWMSLEFDVCPEHLFGSKTFELEIMRFTNMTYALICVLGAAWWCVF